MGMDVYGKNPTKKSGEYFRNNVWYWHPLWGYVEWLTPELAVKAPNAHFNDGDGLDAEDSRTLSKALLMSVRDGTAEEYMNTRQKELDSLEDEQCSYCQGIGLRDEHQCRTCEGKGMVRPFATWYQFSIENVQEFAEFLENCGGFEVC